MRTASALLLATFVAAAAPPPTPAQQVPPHARVFIQSQIPKGLLEFVVYEDSCLVRLDHGPWSSMIPLVALDLLPANGTATAGTTFCAHAVVSGSGPYGTGGQVFHETFTVFEVAETLSEAVANAHEKIKDITDAGWVPEPCPPTTN
jgi:hypothetical protein